MKGGVTPARILAAACLATLVLSGLSLGATARAATGKPVAAKVACAPGATCVTIPANCSGTRCPTVSAEPTTELGQNQWIYLNLSHFPATNPVNVVQIYFCADEIPLTITSPPHCVLEGTPDFSYPNTELPILANGTGATSFQTLDNPKADGDSPFVGEVPGDSTAEPVSFFCGDAKDRCSVDVVDSALLPAGSPDSAVPVPSDTGVVPLGFASLKPACAADFPPTYSDYSIDKLIQHEAPVVCAGRSPVIPLDTPATTSVALSFLRHAGVVFVDDPQAADVRAALAKVHYAIVPVVASAVVIGYVAAMQQDGLKYPFNDFKLTPNEVAGLSVYNYQGPYDGDLVKCRTGTCSAMEELNTVPGFVGASQYGVFPPSDDSSVTEALTDWVCNAPNVPFKLNGTLITDPNTAKHTLTHSLNQTPWPIKRCTAFDTFPALKPLGALFDPAADPLHAVKFLRTFALPPQIEASPVAGFAPIDWADARYNGLDAAALQNADGQFVAPSTASVDAEIAAEPVGNGGYPLPSPALKVRGGYPMSTVIDALVPDSSLPAIEAKPIAEMMNELLDYTTTASLPDGYAPLPPKLAALAHTELADALAAEGVASTSATTTTTTPSTAATQPVPPATISPATTGTSVPVSVTTSVPTKGTRPSKKTTRGLSIADVTLMAATARVALPVALGLGGAFIVCSLALWFLAVIRRRHAKGLDGA